MGNIKSFYLEESDKTPLDKNFFVFHSFAQAVLDLLLENTDIDPISVASELRLLDAVYYLTYNGLLETFSVGQIREDFTADMLLDRCLQLYGIQNYPSDFKKLVGLQEALEREEYHVVLACLNHLDRTHFIEDIVDNDCMYVVDMIEKYLIDAEGLEYNTDLEVKLVKILYQVPTSSSLLYEYILDNMDEKSM